MLGTQLTLPKSMGNNTIFLFQKGVIPFARTAPSWKHAFPGTPGMHTIELMIHNQNTHHKHQKYKVFCFQQKLPSLSAKLSVTHAEHLGQFRLT